MDAASDTSSSIAGSVPGLLWGKDKVRMSEINIHAPSGVIPIAFGDGVVFELGRDFDTDVTLS